MASENKGDNMKLVNTVGFIAGFVMLVGLTQANATMKYAKVYKQECQGCHGSAHQGGVGATLKPQILKKINKQMLVNTILRGKAGTAMPAWGHMFSRNEASGMVEWLIDWKSIYTPKLSLVKVKKTWKKLADAKKLYYKYLTPADVKNVRDIQIGVERDASLVDFYDGTSGKMLSRHKAGYAIHICQVNKRMPRYAYCISRSGRLTMFDLNAPGEPALASVTVGTSSRGIAVSPNGKYVMTGNYSPGGAVLLNAHTLEPLKVYPTPSVINTTGQLGPSRVAMVIQTPYAPYFIFALKDGGHVYIVDYNKPGFPIIADIPNIGKILHDGFENMGKDRGRFVYIASQMSNLIGVIDLKTLKLAAKIYTGPDSKPHPGQGASWYNKRYGQLNATMSINEGNVVIWNMENEVVASVKTAGGGLFVGTGDGTPYIWADDVIGSALVYNRVYLINKQTLKIDRIIKVGKYKGHLIDAHTGKILQTWNATQYKNIMHKEVRSKLSKEFIVPYTAAHGPRLAHPVQPRLLHAEPMNFGKWTTISEWNKNGRIGIYNAKTGRFIKYIYNLTTPTFTYSISHRLKVPGA